MCLLRLLKVQKKVAGDCNPVSSINNLYYRKHNPFMSFSLIRNNPTRCQNIVPATQLQQDINSNSLADFIYYTPNMNNDAHDRNLDFGANFLNGWIKQYMTQESFAKDTLFLFTYDEDEYIEGNKVPAVILGQWSSPKSQIEGNWNHFSLTRSVIDNWGLDSLGRNDVSAQPFLAEILASKQNPQPHDLSKLAKAMGIIRDLISKGKGLFSSN